MLDRHLSANPGEKHLSAHPTDPGGSIFPPTSTISTWCVAMRCPPLSRVAWGTRDLVTGRRLTQRARLGECGSHFGISRGGCESRIHNLSSRFWATPDSSQNVQVAALSRFPSSLGVGTPSRSRLRHPLIDKGFLPLRHFVVRTTAIPERCWGDERRENRCVRTDFPPQPQRKTCCLVCSKTPKVFTKKRYGWIVICM